ncbi:MAG TPA: HlyD family efflux transporter periplasmic adaptor subunit [Bryobacteraceae bacterium]|nr:HlyD family efflux transporter periplasmic adaptor subunit [Bryobacteraceae bacterium]
MQSYFSSVPAPGPGNGGRAVPAEPGPGPAVVPPPHRAGVESHRRRWGILIVLVLVAGGLVWRWKAQQESAAKATAQAVAVRTAEVSTGDLARTIRVTGTIAAERFAGLMAPRIRGSRTGRGRGGTPGGGGGDFNLVLSMLAAPGVHVKEGDVVAQFDPQAQSMRLDDYKDSVVQLEANIRKMEAALKAAKEAQAQTVRSAKADYDKAVLDLKTAEVRSAIDAEKFKLAAEQAKANYDEVSAESALLVDSQEAQIRSSEIDRNQAQIELQRAQDNVTKMTVKAPMNGIVVMQSIVRNGQVGTVRQGDQVYPGQIFLSIVDPSSMIINASVNQVDAEKLRLGMKATLRLDAYPDIRLPATLVGIGAMSVTSTFRANYVGEIPVRLNIDRMDPRVIPDLSGSAEIVLESENNAVIAPRAAVFGDSGSRFVFLKSPSGWVRKTVDLGLANNIQVAVHSGLNKGDVVALQRPL